MWVFCCCCFAVLAFVVNVAAAKFNVVISADVAAVVLHFVLVLVLFLVPAVISDFEIDDGNCLSFHQGFY